MLINFNSLKKNLKKEIKCVSHLKLALLGDSATQFLCTAIRGYGLEFKIDIEIFEAEYNQIHLQLQNPISELYIFNPDYVVIFESQKKLNTKFYNTPNNIRDQFADEQLKKIELYYEITTEKLNAKLFYFSFFEIDDAVFGSFSSKHSSSLLFQTRLINLGLMKLANKLPQLHIVDILSLQNQFGIQYLFDIKNYIQADITLSLDSLPLVAKLIVDQLKVQLGLFKKCLIFDLDNTLWGGVIGDDGLDKIQIGSLGIGKAFTEIQYWGKELKNRGIIICIASKNTESIALEAFDKHPDMILKKEDISVFMVNWDNKVKNIQRIQEILNIGFDSMVFIDDNPFERHIVKENLPEVTVPDLPDDPSEYLTYLKSLNLFETSHVSALDEVRTEKYKTEETRIKHLSLFENEDDFLADLNMIAEVSTLNSFNTPRASQLTLRSNQFNLRTVRFTEEELHNYNSAESNHVITFSLKDKFGDHGLIGVILLKKENNTEMFIENWAMSCRVLKRGMESFIINSLSEIALAHQCDFLIGEYIPTPKNGIVKDLYQSLGFVKNKDEKWILNLENFKSLKTFITK